MFGRFPRLAVAAVLAGAGVVASGGPASASTTCVSDNGTDVNAYFGIKRADAIWLNIQGLRPACVSVTEGNDFYRVNGWITQVPPGTPQGSVTVDPVYPEGYRPDHPAPMRDFLSKLVQERIVVHSGGREEIVKIVKRRPLLARGKLGRFSDLFVAPWEISPGVTIYPDAPEWTSRQRLDSRGLAVGRHTVDIYWTLAKRHCDGLAPDPVADCLAAGESLVSSAEFDVVPRN